MTEDGFGNRLTAANVPAAEAYNAGVDLMLTAYPGAEAKFDAALDADPDFALAHIARARAVAMQGRADEAQAAVAAAQAQATRLTDRERAHVRALALALGGDSAGAIEAIKAHMREWPRDGLALSLTTGVYGLLGFSGVADHHQRQRDLLDAIAEHWGADWWFNAYRGWAHVEAGDAAFGAPLIERSLAERRANGNAAHGRAHAFYELGEATGGAAFLDDWLPDYAPNGSLHTHLSWHLALFALRLGAVEKAQALYAERIDPARHVQPPFFAIVDAGAFNWRCLLRGLERADGELAAVSTFAAKHFPGGGVGFANVHIAYAYAAHGDREALAKHVAMTEQNDKSAAHPSAPVVHAVCRGVQAFAAGDYVSAAAHIEQALPELPRIGGSCAQRDGVWETLVAACLRSGQAEKAQTLLEQRLGLKAIFA